MMHQLFAGRPCFPPWVSDTMMAIAEMVLIS